MPPVNDVSSVRVGSCSVSAPGFRSAEQKDVLLKPGDRTGVQITLSIGDVNQTVEVEAA